MSGRLKKLLEILRRETKILHIEKDIQSKVNEQMDKNQRDYYLREQCGRFPPTSWTISDDTPCEECRGIQGEDRKNKKLPEEAREKLLMKRTACSKCRAILRRFRSPHLSGHMSDLPWDTRTEDNLTSIRLLRFWMGDITA